MTVEQSLAEPTSSRSTGVMICGCLLGLASALALVWDGNVCASMLDVLLFRPSADGTGTGGEIADLGTKLLRVSWAPVGLAAGTALTLIGLQQAMRRVGRSKVSSTLVLLSAIIASLGAFQIKSGIRQTQDFMLVGATPRNDADPEATLAPSVDALARGWLLLVIAQATLTGAAIAQTMTRSNIASSSHVRSKEDLAVIVLMGLFGVIVSWSWFSNGLAIERTRGQKSIKASEFVAQVDHVLSSTDWGAWALLASMTVLVFTTGMDSSRHVSSSASRNPS